MAVSNGQIPNLIVKSVNTLHFKKTVQNCFCQNCWLIDES